MNITPEELYRNYSTRSGLFAISEADCAEIRASLVVDDDDSEDDGDTDENKEEDWPLPRGLWNQFTDSERRWLFALWPFHQNGVGLDEQHPVTPQLAENYLPRLRWLYSQLDTIESGHVRMDACRMCFVFRCALAQALGRDAILEERLETKRNRKAERDQTRNADPVRKAAEAARQRARRQRIKAEKGGQS